MFDEIKTEGVQEAVSKYLGKYRTEINFIGLLIWGSAFVFDKILEPTIIVTLFKLGGFLLFIGGQIKARKNDNTSKNRAVQNFLDELDHVISVVKQIKDTGNFEEIPLEKLEIEKNNIKTILADHELEEDLDNLMGRLYNYNTYQSIIQNEKAIIDFIKFADKAKKLLK